MTTLYSGAPSGDVATDTATLQSLVDQAFAQGDTTVVIEEGRWEVSSPISALLTADTAARVSIVGDGGCTRRTRVYQITPGQPTFSLRTTTGNLRDVSLSGIAICGSVADGSGGLDLGGTAYLQLHDLCFFQAGRAVTADASAQAQFHACTWIHSGVCAEARGGAVLSFHGCKFGEDVGGFRAIGGTIDLAHCYGHSLGNRHGADSYGQRPWSEVTSGGSLRISGGRYTFATDGAQTITTLVRADKSRDLLIGGMAAIVLPPSCTSLVEQVYCDRGTEPGALCSVGDALITAMAPGAFTFFREMIAGAGFSKPVARCTVEAQSVAAFAWTNATVEKSQPSSTSAMLRQQTD